MQQTSLKSQIYNLEHQYKRSCELLTKDKQIISKNKEMIRQYVQDRLAMGVTKTRAMIIISHLRRLARLTPKSFSDFTEKDLKSLMIALESKDLNIIVNINVYYENVSLPKFSNCDIFCIKLCI